MAHLSDLNRLQVELIQKGLCTEEEVLEMIDARKSQARQTRDDIDKITRKRGCSRNEAYKILRKRRQKQRKK